MGKSQSSVANKLRLLSLPDDIQDAILKERISERHARALLTVEDPTVQKQLVEEIVSTKMSVRALEDKIKQMYPSAKDASEIPVNNDITAIPGGFLDSTPLTPTASAVQEQTSNYGKVVIAPPKEMLPEEPKEEVKPEGENEEGIPTSRFVNYGEIGKDANLNVGISGVGLPSAGTGVNVDINEVKENTQDIKKVPTNGAALDNLLNIAQPVTNPISIEEKQQKEDYFSMPNMPELKIEAENLPPTAVTPVSNEPEPTSPVINLPVMTPVAEENQGVLPSITIPTENYTAADATQKLKELIVDLKDHGVNITADEMNFPKSYQVIIKIEK